MTCRDCPHHLPGHGVCGLLAETRELLDCATPRIGCREDCPLLGRVRLRLVGGVIEVNP